MAKRTKKTKKASQPTFIRRWYLTLRKWALWGAMGVFGFYAFVVILFSVINPPITPYILSERMRLGAVARDWVPIEEIAPVMARSAVAAEDANYCQHWGFDLDAIQTALADGAGRGASTISQQTVKNVYLWHGRSWFRKSLEAMLTPAVELAWSKRRILEVYLNVAEFDQGVFGVQAAARHYFGVDAADLSASQAARLAAILPDPKGRSASNPSSFVRSQAERIIDGAATIANDGRADCFQIALADN